MKRVTKHRMKFKTVSHFTIINGNISDNCMGFQQLHMSSVPMKNCDSYFVGEN